MHPVANLNTKKTFWCLIRAWKLRALDIGLSLHASYCVGIAVQRIWRSGLDICGRDLNLKLLMRNENSAVFRRTSAGVWPLLRFAKDSERGE